MSVCSKHGVVTTDTDCYRCNRERIVELQARVKELVAESNIVGKENAKLQARVTELEEMILDLGYCTICGWRKDFCEHASKWQALGGKDD